MLQLERPGAADPDLEGAVGAEPLGRGVIGQRAADDIRPIVQHPGLGETPRAIQRLRQLRQKCRQGAGAVRFFRSSHSL